MAKFRKKPVVVEARQVTPETAEEIGAWCGAKKCIDKSYNSYLWGHALRIEHRHLYIETPEGEHTASMGDWIIKGVIGEYYPCKPDIFEMTYEEVPDGTNS
jgi:hypothetical protein